MRMKSSICGSAKNVTNCFAFLSTSTASHVNCSKIKQTHLRSRRSKGRHKNEDTANSCSTKSGFVRAR